MCACAASQLASWPAGQLERWSAGAGTSEAEKASRQVKSRQNTHTHALLRSWRSWRMAQLAHTLAPAPHPPSCPCPSERTWRLAPGTRHQVPGGCRRAGGEWREWQYRTRRVEDRGPRTTAPRTGRSVARPSRARVAPCTPCAMYGRVHDVNCIGVQTTCRPHADHANSERPSLSLPAADSAPDVSQLSALRLPSRGVRASQRWPFSDFRGH